MQQPIRIERADRQDSRFIAEMIAVSSDGIACIEWQQEAEAAGVDPLDIGAQNYADDNGDYSYRNCWIARGENRQAVGMILSFAITAANISTDAKPPPYADDDIFAPYKYLEAVDSWYICGVANLPEYRGRGIGRLLLERAMAEGKEAGFDNASLIVVANKTRLVAYHESLGFRITRRAPIVEHPAIDAHGEALLMETKPAG